MTNSQETTIKYEYQVGGSLQINAPSYVKRQADTDLYNALKNGEFCYVLNSRQMSKSSLKVRVKNRLEEEGIVCTSIDMTRIGSEEITTEQWYNSICLDLLRGLKLFKPVKFKKWWKSRKDLSAPQRLIKLIEEIILTQIENKKIVIFIDEIDSIISLPFSSDDFFALIRSCYNRRAEKKQYDRLTFVLLGVATPGDLIRDRTRTPFNIGQPIYLSGFKLAEVEPLIKGLETVLKQPQETLAEILSWTGGQPFLTQKICNLIVQNCTVNNKCDLKNVENIVKERIIENWETQDEPEHLKTISARILDSEKQAVRLLGLYQKILEKGYVKSSDSREQELLLLSGLVVKKEGKLKVYNQIYQKVFNKKWVSEQLNKLRPYAESLNKWLASNRQDKSRLLRGNTLKIAEKWAIEKSLSDEDYQFLAASEALEQEIQQRAIEAERFRELQARLLIEAENAKIQKRFLAAVSFGCIIASGLGFTAFLQSRQATIREIKATAQSSLSLSSDDSQLEGLTQAILAKRQLQNLGIIDSETSKQVNSALGRAIYQIYEFNRLSGHTNPLFDVDFSPDRDMYATASLDGTVKLWAGNGKLLQSIAAHQGRISSVKFLAEGKVIVSAGMDDKTLKFWNLQGELLNTFKFKTAISFLDFDPNNNLIAAGTFDRKVKLLDLEGKLIHTFTGHKGLVGRVDISPDGKYIASGSIDKTIKIWDVEKRTLHRTLQGHTDVIYGVKFSVDSKTLLSTSEDGTVKEWTIAGELLKTIEVSNRRITYAQYRARVHSIMVLDFDTLKVFQPDGTLTFVLEGHHDLIVDSEYGTDDRVLATASLDKTVKIWTPNPFLIANITTHNAAVRGVGFSGDNTYIITASRDNTAKIWTIDGTLQNSFTPHTQVITDLDVSPDGKTIATVSEDRTLKIWQLDGKIINTSLGHTDGIYAVAWSPDGKYIVTGSIDKTVKLWTKDGKLLRTFTGHQDIVRNVDFSPDSRLIASASQDGTVKIWQLDGTLLRTIKAHDLGVTAAVFDPRGKFIITGSRDRTDPTVKMWTMEGKLIKTLTGHKAKIWDVIFSPDGEIFATAADDNTIKLWDRNGQLLKTIYIDYLTRSLAFSSDGKMLITGGRDNKTRIWNVSKIIETNKLEFACNWARDYLKNNAEVAQSDRNLCD